MRSLCSCVLLGFFKRDVEGLLGRIGSPFLAPVANMMDRARSRSLGVLNTL